MNENGAFTYNSSSGCLYTEIHTVNCTLDTICELNVNLGKDRIYCSTFMGGDYATATVFPSGNYTYTWSTVQPFPTFISPAVDSIQGPLMIWDYGTYVGYDPVGDSIPLSVDVIVMVTDTVSGCTASDTIRFTHLSDYFFYNTAVFNYTSDACIGDTLEANYDYQFYSPLPLPGYWVDPSANVDTLTYSTIVNENGIFTYNSPSTAACLYTEVHTVNCTLDTICELNVNLGKDRIYCSTFMGGDYATATVFPSGNYTYTWSTVQPFPTFISPAVDSIQGPLMIWDYGTYVGYDPVGDSIPLSVDVIVMVTDTVSGCTASDTIRFTHLSDYFFYNTAVFNYTSDACIGDTLEANYDYQFYSPLPLPGYWVDPSANVDTLTYSTIVNENGIFTYNSPSTAACLYTEVHTVNCILTETISKTSRDVFARVFPNPTNGLINLELKNSNHILIKLYDLTGKELKTIISNSNIYNLDVSQHKGIYFIEIESGANKQVEKIIIY